MACFMVCRVVIADLKVIQIRVHVQQSDTKTQNVFVENKTLFEYHVTQNCHKTLHSMKI